MTAVATAGPAGERPDGQDVVSLSGLDTEIRDRVKGLLESQDFRDALLREVWDLQVGCAGRIANRLDPPMRAEEVQPVLEDFVQRGLLEKETIGELSEPPTKEEILTQTLYVVPQK